MASRDELQTLKRGLKALAILVNEGPSNVACIARRLEVPRANAHRIINTLTAEGYCRKIPNSHLYIADVLGIEAASSPSVDSVITCVAIAIVEDLGGAIKWPLALSMPHGANMISRLATHLSSPLALAKITPGHMQSMLEASTGIAYLALTDEATRQAVLSEVSTALPTVFGVWEPHFPRVFAAVRDEGYFIMRRTGPEASLGVPILLDGQPVAGLAMRYMKSCVSRSTAVDVYLPQLREAAQRIETRIGSLLERRRLPRIGRPPAPVHDQGWTGTSLAAAPSWHLERRISH